jgi:biopolymer transport protein ExbD
LDLNNYKDRLLNERNRDIEDLRTQLDKIMKDKHNMELHLVEVKANNKEKEDNIMKLNSIINEYKFK